MFSLEKKVSYIWLSFPKHYCSLWFLNIASFICDRKLSTDGGNENCGWKLSHHNQPVFPLSEKEKNKTHSSAFHLFKIKQWGVESCSYIVVLFSSNINELNEQSEDLSYPHPLVKKAKTLLNKTEISEHKYQYKEERRRNILNTKPSNNLKEHRGVNTLIHVCCHTEYKVALFEELGLVLLIISSAASHTGFTFAPFTAVIQ